MFSTDQCIVIFQLDGDCYIAGADFSMADVAFFPAVAFFVRVGLSLDTSYPHLAKYYKKMCERKSVKASWPPHWKESDGSKLLADL